jgi:Zn-dependent protease with chaperone function
MSGGVAATYHDGRTSAARAVTVHVADGLVHVEGDGMATAVPLAQVRLEPRLGTLPRRLDLPNGASCLVPADFELPIEVDAPARMERWVNEAEIRWAPALIAAVLVLVGLWATIVYGVPAAANVVARRISPSLERGMGSQALQTLDRVALKPTALSAERQAQLLARFRTLADLSGLGQGVQLLFRASPAVGPNAFALPGGTLVVLDELVAEAKDDDEVMAVLAHEIGHVHERHTLRHVLQTSALGVLLATVLGDVVSATSYAVAAVPAFLLDARYSRAFEREADDYGFALLDRAGIDRAQFARFLSRLEAKSGGGSLPGWISTHPPAVERVR